jgi:anthranilate phosphoribosyltransferase
MGLDEITLAGPTQVVELKDGGLRQFEVTPEDAGLPRAPTEALRGGTPEENAIALNALLEGAPGPYRDCVLLNAAAALIVAGQVENLRDGVVMAARSLDAGAALDVLRKLRTAATPPPPEPEASA